MKKVFALLLCLALVLSFAGCKKTETPPAPPTPPADKPLKVCNLINGTLGDLSFFDSAENGMKMLKAELGDKFEYTTIEMSYDETKWEPALLDAADEASGYDIIICGTWQMQSLLEKHAATFPNKTFILYDSSVVWANGDFSNIACIEYKQNEGSYLAGVLAATMSKTGKLGFLGGMDNPVINDFLVGYIQGAVDTKADIKIAQSFVGNFSDSAKGSDLAKVQFENGVDVGFACAGQAGLGMFEAAVAQGGKTAGITMIGVDSDQAMIFKGSDKMDRAEITATSMLKRVDISLYNAVKSYIDGTLKKGDTNYVGMNEGCIGLADNEFYQSIVPADVKAAVEAAAAKIKDGTIKVNTAFGMDQAALDAYRNGVKP